MNIYISSAFHNGYAAFIIPGNCLSRRIIHSKKEDICEYAPNAFLFTISCSLSMLQHIFNKYPIPFRGILYQHMGNGANDFSVLDNRRTTHPLDDSPGQ